MSLSSHATRILRRLHDALQPHGHKGFDEFRTQLHELCVDSKRMATEKEFRAAMAGAGLLSAEDADILFGGFARNGASGKGDRDHVSFAQVRVTSNRCRKAYPVLHRNSRTSGSSSSSSRRTRRKMKTGTRSITVETRATEEAILFLGYEKL